MMNDDWGFTDQIEKHWKTWLVHNAQFQNSQPARIITRNHHEYRCALPNAQIVRSRVSGAYRNSQQGGEGFPVVGDWVVLDLLPAGDEGIIAGLLPRLGGVKRLAAGDETREQFIATNLNYILLVFALDGGRNFLSSMVERSLTVAWSSGAQPLIVLNKVDCASQELRSTARAEAEALAFGVPVHLVSAKSLEGVAALAECIEPEKTVAMLGKSGVGKSALVNAFFSLYSEGQSRPATEGELRGDGQGRHTTTNSSLYPLPWGAFIIDVPGLRELKIWSDEDDLALAFPDIELLISECRFRNCSHESEPGCAVRNAMEDGGLTERRYESYKKLQKEIAWLERRQDQRAAQEERKKWKNISKQLRNRKSLK